MVDANRVGGEAEALLAATVGRRLTALRAGQVDLGLSPTTPSRCTSSELWLTTDAGSRLRFVNDALDSAPPPPDHDYGQDRYALRIDPGGGASMGPLIWTLDSPAIDRVELYERVWGPTEVIDQSVVFHAGSLRLCIAVARGLGSFVVAIRDPAQIEETMGDEEWDPRVAFEAV